MLKHISETLKSSTRFSKSLTAISPLHTRSKTLISNSSDQSQDLQSSDRLYNPTQLASKPAEPAESEASIIQISHQWPEWIGLIERLMTYGYFESVGNPFRSGQLIDGKSCNRIRTACLNFARDRPDLMRCFMDRDIQTIAGSGCPSVDRKVVNSGKRLRAHLGIDEGDVCSSCNLRGNCERAYMKAHGDESGLTVDVMRLVLTYGLDHNKPFINKRIEEAVRSLTKDMVKFSKNTLDIDPLKRVPSVPRSPAQQQEHRSTSSIHGGWNCSKCKFLNIARNIKCMRCNNTFDEGLPRSRNHQNHVPLKGDWLCVRCLQCHTNPPQRQLNSGEWECDSCNYINFKRNMVCLKCDHKRPKALNHSTQLLFGSTTRR